METTDQQTPEEMTQIQKTNYKLIEDQILSYSRKIVETKKRLCAQQNDLFQKT